MAEKRSRRETWRVRECVALCVKMVASAPHIQGQAMDDVQVRARISFDTTLPASLWSDVRIISAPNLNINR